MGSTTTTNLVRATPRIETWNTVYTPNTSFLWRLSCTFCCSGEVGDPDNVERNMAWIRGMNAPMPVKYTLVVLTMCVWKWYVPLERVILVSR